MGNKDWKMGNNAEATVVQMPKVQVWRGPFWHFSRKETKSKLKRQEPHPLSSFPEPGKQFLGQEKRTLEIPFRNLTYGTWPISSMIYLRMYDIPVRKPFTYQRGNLDMDDPSPLTSYQTPGPPAVDPPFQSWDVWMLISSNYGISCANGFIQIVLIPVLTDGYKWVNTI